MMKKNLPALLASVDNFYRTAGALKVPESLLDDVTNFIIASYCQYMTPKLAALIHSFEKRVTNSTRLDDMLSYWYAISSVCWEIHYDMQTGQEDRLQYLIDKLIAEIESVPFNKRYFPKITFNKNEIDGWVGEISDISHAFMRIEKYKSPENAGKYHFEFFAGITSANLPKKEKSNDSSDESELTPILANIRKGKLTAKEVGMLILHNMKKISMLPKILEAFRYHFEVPDENYLKQFKGIYAMCSAKSQSAKEVFETSQDQSKNFEISISDLPYPKGLNAAKLGSIVFSARFVNGKKEAKTVYDKEAWAGLWRKYWRFPQDSGVFRNFIGSLFVTRSIKEDFEQIKKLSRDNSLPEIFDEIRRIVRHELQHFIQDTIQFLNNLKEDGGLPSKKIRNKDYNPSGFKQDDRSRQEHALRDVEFYTRLSDCIDYFNQAKVKLPVAVHKDFAKAWLGIISVDQFRDIAKMHLKNYLKKTKGIAPEDTSQDWDLNNSVKWQFYKVEDAIAGMYNDFFIKLKNFQIEEEKEFLKIKQEKMKLKLESPKQKRVEEIPVKLVTKYQKAATEFLKGINLQ